MKKTFFILIAAILCQSSVIRSAEYSEHVIRNMADNLGLFIADASQTGMNQSEIDSGLVPIKNSIAQELSGDQSNIFTQHLDEYIHGKRPSQHEISQLALQDANDIKNFSLHASVTKIANLLDIIKITRTNMFAKRELDIFSSVFEDALNV